MFRKIPDWIPTRSDQISNRREELDRIDREYVRTLHKQMELTLQANEIQQQLENTFDKNQMELWLKMKTFAQVASFHSQRLAHFDRQREQLPREIDDLERGYEYKPEFRLPKLQALLKEE